MSRIWRRGFVLSVATTCVCDVLACIVAHACVCPVNGLVKKRSTRRVASNEAVLKEKDFKQVTQVNMICGSHVFTFFPKK